MDVGAGQGIEYICILQPLLFSELKYILQQILELNSIFKQSLLSLGMLRDSPEGFTASQQWLGEKHVTDCSIFAACSELRVQS